MGDLPRLNEKEVVGYASDRVPGLISRDDLNDLNCCNVLNGVQVCYRTTEIAIVPETTQTAPRIVRRVTLSMPRRKSHVPTRIHNGLVATMGETITTCPTLNATITSRIPNVSKTPAIKNQPIDCRFQTGWSPLVGKTT